ncbi:hypothetical protein SEA_SCHIMMELS22_60 [Microbacterium phage Schimmels22]|nr:hypothetical protein SEA_SCHIMMELS22_60 [Microbacterium phage Schimmels22]
MGRKYAEKSLRDIGRDEREARLKAAGKTSRAEAEQELEGLRSMMGETTQVPVCRQRIRVRSSVRVLDQEWVEVRMQIRLRESGGWIDVIAEDHPLLLSRGLSRVTECETQTDYVEAVLRRFVTMDAGLVWRLGAWESRVGQGVTEYRAWVDLSARLSVAVRTRADGMLNVYGL